MGLAARSGRGHPVAVTVVDTTESGNQDHSQGLGSYVSSLRDAGCLSHRYPAILWATIQRSGSQCSVTQRFSGFIRAAPLPGGLWGWVLFCCSDLGRGGRARQLAPALCVHTSPCHCAQQLKEVTL